MAKVKKKVKSNVISVNFKGVEGRSLIPVGDYPVKVVAATVEKGSEHPYIAWEFQITSGKHKGKKLFTNTSLGPNSLWNLRNLLEAMGQEVPDSETDIDLDDMVDGEFVAYVEHEDYKGAPRAKVVAYGSIDDHEEVEAEEGEEEEEEEEESEEEEEESEEEEEEPKKGSKKTSKKSSKKDEEEDEEEESEEEEEESEEEEEEAGLSADDVNEMSTSELKDLIKEHKLKVSLDDFKTTRRKRAAVVSALEKKGII